MATVTKDYFVKNKDKWSSRPAAWLLGATTDKPLPKTRHEALFNYLDTGELEYLPDDSDVILNALTDGLSTDNDRVTLCIPNKCKCDLLYWQSISDVKYYTQGEERPVGDPLRTRVETYLAWESHNSHSLPTLAASAAPTYPGRLGPISVLNPVHPTQPDVKVKGKGKVKSEKGKRGM